MFNTNRIVTLDLEGDGLSKKVNQNVFPNGCHFDPGTRIWCATLTTRSKEGGIVTETYTTKLNGTRPVYIKDSEGNYRMAAMTTAEHYESTVIPTEVDTIFGNHYITPCDTTTCFMQRLILELCNYSLNGYEIWIKGYRDKEGNYYKYDRIALLNATYKAFTKTSKKVINLAFVKNGIKFRDAAAEFPKLQVNWPGTTEQVQIGDFKDNQTYMNTGIIHNIEDSYQLFTMVERYAKEANANERIKGDF
jgi:hypothetical protein